jgi:hypothetical protein
MVEFFEWYLAERRWLHRISPPFLASEKGENFVSLFLFHTDSHQRGNICCTKCFVSEKKFLGIEKSPNGFCYPNELLI